MGFGMPEPATQFTQTFTQQVSVQCLYSLHPVLASSWNTAPSLAWRLSTKTITAPIAEDHVYGLSPSGEPALSPIEFSE